MRIRSLACCTLTGLLTSGAIAAPPVFHANTCPLKLDGVRVGSDLTTGGSSLRNTIAYEPATGLYHFWGFVADDASFPSAASALGAVRHATSRDGIHFTSDGSLTYGVGSASYTTFGAGIDPPLDFFRAALDDTSGTWKLFNWTENDQVASPSFGQYNYNTSVNDLGTLAGNTSVLHEGPLSAAGVAGNHVGAFGLIGGNLYLRIDGSAADGGAAAYPYTDAIPPTLGTLIEEANLFAGTPYCWGLDPACGSTDPRIPAYVHNVGRTLRQDDGTLGTYYAFRHWDGSRIDKQIWYAESTDGGATWSQPAGVFVDGNAVTIAWQPLDAAADSANFSSAEVALNGSRYIGYFSTQDAAGAYVMVGAQGRPSDAVFFDDFDECAD